MLRKNRQTDRQTDKQLEKQNPVKSDGGKTIQKVHCSAAEQTFAD